MRIAILYRGSISRRSGTDERVLQIAKGLAYHGAQVILSGAVDNGLETKNLKKLQIIVRPDRVLNIPGVLVWLVQLIASGLECKYDVIQIESFSLPRSLFLCLIMHPFSRKFVIVFHDKMFNNDPRKSFIGRLNLILQKTLLVIFDASITPGISVKKRFEELHGEIVHRKMIVIPNGVPNLNINENIYDLNLREKYRVNLNAYVILFFGSMAFKPNWDAAIKLYNMSNLVSNRFEKITMKKLTFIVGGIGSETLPRTDCFIPLGFVEKLEELFSLPDVIVFPHAPSNSGPHVKTIYAFLSQKPIIATEDAVKDMPLIIPRKHFILFDIQKPDTLLASILELYHDKELREKLVFNAYQYSKKYSWEKISSLHLELYTNLLQKVRAHKCIRGTLLEYWQWCKVS